MKFCNYCKKDKEDNDFTPSQFKKSAGWCKPCVKEYNSKYYKNNDEKMKKTVSEYQKNNKEKVSAYQKAYHAIYDQTRDREKRKAQKHKMYWANPEKYRREARERLKNLSQEEKIRIQKLRNEYNKNRRKTDPIFRLHHHISTIIQRKLKFNKQGKSIIKYLDYSLDELKSHIESQFRDGMTWDNYGIFGWHLDHIKAYSNFNITSLTCDEFKKCWSLNNLQPLWWYENLSKSDSIDIHEEVSIDELIDTLLETPVEEIV